MDVPTLAKIITQVVLVLKEKYGLSLALPERPSTPLPSSSGSPERHVQSSEAQKRDEQRTHLHGRENAGRDGSQASKRSETTIERDFARPRADGTGLEAQGKSGKPSHRFEDEGQAVEYGSRPRQSERYKSAESASYLAYGLGKISTNAQRSCSDVGPSHVLLDNTLVRIALFIIRGSDSSRYMAVNAWEMYQFFAKTPIMGEQYSWKTIFQDHALLLPQKYMWLECEQILFSRSVASYPWEPALTPHGFSQFITQLLEADPTAGFERVWSAIQAMRLANGETTLPDRERLRQLMPERSNVPTKQRLAKILSYVPPPPPGPPPRPDIS